MAGANNMGGTPTPGNPTAPMNKPPAYGGKGGGHQGQTTGIGSSTPYSGVGQSHQIPPHMQQYILNMLNNTNMQHKQGMPSSPQANIGQTPPQQTQTQLHNAIAGLGSLGPLNLPKN